MFKSSLLRIIRFYQNYISPNLGSNCRFYPSCSEYSYISIKKYGIIRGSAKGIKRISRCHPFNKGGVDLP